MLVIDEHDKIVQNKEGIEKSISYHCFEPLSQIDITCDPFSFLVYTQCFDPYQSYFRKEFIGFEIRERLQWLIILFNENAY